jgi:hypothetical protein
MSELYEQIKIVQEAYNKGFLAGKKGRDEEIKREREKEIEAMYQAHLKEVEEDEKFDYHPLQGEEN